MKDWRSKLIAQELITPNSLAFIAFTRENNFFPYLSARNVIIHEFSCLHENLDLKVVVKHLNYPAFQSMLHTDLFTCFCLVLTVHLYTQTYNITSRSGSHTVPLDRKIKKNKDEKDMKTIATSVFRGLSLGQNLIYSDK